jgi:uncharacterized protein (TIGR02598 family)
MLEVLPIKPPMEKFFELFVRVSPSSRNPLSGGAVEDPVDRPLPFGGSSRRSWRGGFSLVEVTIAMGLVSFAVLAILGVFPVGLSSLRQSMNQTVEAQILRSISGQSVVANFTTLATNGIYFDNDGQLCDAGKAFYTVNVTTAAPKFPGSTNAAALTNNLTTLRVEILHKPGGVASAGTTNSYTLLVANCSK